MRVFQRHAGDDAKLLIKFHWPKARLFADDTKMILIYMKFLVVTYPRTKLSTINNNTIHLWPTIFSGRLFHNLMVEGRKEKRHVNYIWWSKMLRMIPAGCTRWTLLLFLVLQEPLTSESNDFRVKMSFSPSDYDKSYKSTLKQLITTYVNLNSVM